MEKDIYFRVVNKEKEITYETTDKEIVYNRLASCLIAKFINKAPWIKRMTHSCNYDGTYSYNFKQDNGYTYSFRVER